jgi:hypothetical protein
MNSRKSCTAFRKQLCAKFLASGSEPVSGTATPRPRVRAKQGVFQTPKSQAGCCTISARKPQLHCENESVSRNRSRLPCSIPTVNRKPRINFCCDRPTIERRWKTQRKLRFAACAPMRSFLSNSTSPPQQPRRNEGDTTATEPLRGLSRRLHTLKYESSNARTVLARARRTCSSRACR